MCTCATYLGRGQLCMIFARSHIKISNWIITVQTHLRGSFCWFVLEHDLNQCNLIGLPSATIDQWQLLPSFLEHFVHLYIYNVCTIYMWCLNVQCRCHPNFRYQVFQLHAFLKCKIFLGDIQIMCGCIYWCYLTCLFHRARQHAKNVSWLRRTEYISTEFARSHGSSESAETKWAEAFLDSTFKLSS